MAVRLRRHGVTTDLLVPAGDRVLDVNREGGGTLLVHHLFNAVAERLNSAAALNGLVAEARGLQRAEVQRVVRHRRRPNGVAR